MAESSATQGSPVVSTLAPFTVPVFRRIWTASLVSNAAVMIQSVGAAWAMSLIASAQWVALVQTATFLPLALLTLPAGALADTFDRKRVQIVALLISMFGAIGLVIASELDILSPPILLGLCFWIGCGMAVMGPAWQASVSEQVGADLLPPAITLNGMSYNVARSFGPALGGGIVAAMGASVAFLINAIGYIPMIIALVLWKRVIEPSRLPPERFFSAIGAGVRYVFNLTPARSVILRIFFFGLGSSALNALMPLVARDLLGGDAQTFGLLLGSFGVGSVLLGLNINWIRRFHNESIVRVATAILAVLVFGVGSSAELWLTMLLLLGCGAAWMSVMTTATVTLQLFVPRWVMGRAVALNTTSICLGASFGSWFWGESVLRVGTGTTLHYAAGILLATLLAGFFFRVQDRLHSTEDADLMISDPTIKLGINGRSGPVLIEVSYEVAPEQARDFYNVMQELRLIRQRNGAKDWMLSRDIAAPEKWQERFRCSTWDGYLRLRSRGTVEERVVFERARDMHVGLSPISVRRLLERPVGSVRWQEESPDRGDIEPIA